MITIVLTPYIGLDATRGNTSYLVALITTPVATHYFIKVARTTMGLEWR